jgi:hypothetical protein
MLQREQVLRQQAEEVAQMARDEVQGTTSLRNIQESQIKQLNEEIKRLNHELLQYQSGSSDLVGLVDLPAC